MKRLINKEYSHILALFVLIILSSCEKENVDDIATNHSGSVEYADLNAKLPEGYEVSVLSLTLTDLQNQYYSLKSSSNSKNTSSDDIDITLEEMDYLITELLKKYPNTNSLTQNDIALIQQDFNGISEQEIYENIDVIDNFYDAIVRYEYIQILANYNRTASGHNSRVLKLKSTNDYLGYDVSKAEFWALVWHPRLINPTRDATDKAFELTDQYFPNQVAWRTKADAFRHAIWNALIAKYVGNKKNKVSKCTDWAKKFTDKHEEGTEKPDDMSQSDFEVDQEMDYHNNKIGREYFKSVAWVDKRKWYQSSVVKAPSNETMADAIFSKTEVAKKVSSKSQISDYPDNLVYIK